MHFRLYNIIISGKQNFIVIQTINLTAKNLLTLADRKSEIETKTEQYSTEPIRQILGSNVLFEN